MYLIFPSQCTQTGPDSSALFLLAVLQISAGFQQVKLGERGGRRRDFHDAGVNTRHAMEHVKESKSGLSSVEINVHQHIQQMYTGGEDSK